MVSSEDILRKYGARLDREVKGYNSRVGSRESVVANRGDKSFSTSYEKFRGSEVGELSGYERWCKSMGNFFTMKVGEKDRARLDRAIDIAKLNIMASEAVVFAVMLMFLTLFGGLMVFVAIYFFSGALNFMFLFMVFLLSIFLFYYFNKMPERLAMRWRLKASAQMVPAILYVVIYMKHTSNFERAIDFAAQNLGEPLKRDFQKIFWDVETGKFSNVKDAMDAYLAGWRDYSLEFVEAFHLIESSLYEPSEGRRVATLEKALQVILDGVYDKMLKYTHDAKAPLTNVYMLGIVLPTLALAILPIGSTMLGGSIKWFHVMLVFNILIPFGVIYMTENILMRRPGGYGETGLLEKNPLYSKYKSSAGYVKGCVLAFPLFLLGIVPFLWRYTAVPEWLGTTRDYTWSSLGLSFMGDGGVFGILTDSAGGLSGPFGAGALFLSLFVPVSVAIVFIVAFKDKTKDILGMRDKYKEVEGEFTSSLFQLGNRLGDGTPAESAFMKVMGSVKGTATEGFFRVVNENIGQLGFGLERALFDRRRGAVVFYPSELVATSMRILVESVKKGLGVAARSLMAISEYVKNVKKINDRLNDLLADIISDMKSNMVFLAPLLSGIIVGLAGMITTILSALSDMFSSGDLASSSLSSVGNLSSILSIFDVTAMIPTYWLQVVVGVYLIEIVFILTSALVTIKSGQDELLKTSETGKNLRSAMLLYFVVAAGSIVGLSVIGAMALAGLT